MKILLLGFDVLTSYQKVFPSRKVNIFLWIHHFVRILPFQKEIFYSHLTVHSSNPDIGKMLVHTIGSPLTYW